MNKSGGTTYGVPSFSTPVAIVTMIDPRDEFYENFLQMKGMDLKEQYLSSHAALKGSLNREEVVDLGVIDRKAKVYEAADAIGASGGAGIIINLPGWAPPGWGGIIHERTGLPILINAPFALSGPMAMRGELESLGADYDISLGETKKLAQFLQRAKAGKLLEALHGKRFGNVGGISMEMHYAELSSAGALLDFGVEIIYIDGALILDRANIIDSERLAAFMARLGEATGGLPDDPSGVLRRQVSYYLALKDIADEEGIDFLSVKCQPEFSDRYSCLCFVPTFLPLPYDLEGEKNMVPVSCEGDFFASMAAYLLMLLSGKPPLFADFIIPLYEENLLALQNCGGAPVWYAGNIDNPGEGMKGFALAKNVQGMSGSFCVDYNAKAIERVTIFGMGKRRDAYWASALLGEVIEREDLKPLLMDWPTFFLKVPDARECIRAFYTQHVAMVPGDHTMVLAELKRLLEGGG